MAAGQDRPGGRPRSWEVTEGPERAPARAMLRAVGFSEEDFGKPQVGVASSWNEVTPCNYHLDKLAALAKEGVRQGGAVPIEFTTIAVSDGIAMGHEGMKAQPDQPRDHRRLGRARHARRAPRRDGDDRRLRQEPAGHADGVRSDEPAGGLRVRGHDPAGRAGRPRHHDPGRVRGGRRERERHHERRRAPGGRAQRLPDRGVVRRHVHRQHHGGRGRGDRHVAARQREPTGRGLPPRGRRARGRPGGLQAPARGRTAPARHHDGRRLPQRDRRHDGAGRLHERRPAPARHRTRGRRAAGAR